MIKEVEMKINFSSNSIVHQHYMHLLLIYKRKTPTIASLKNQITTENLVLALYCNSNYEVLWAGNY